MTKALCIQYALYGNTQFCNIRISYRLETEGSAKRLSCMVTPFVGDEPVSWLRAKQFEMRAERQGRSYAMLFNDANHQSNLDTSLFIEKACQDILRHENLMLC